MSIADVPSTEAPSDRFIRYLRALAIRSRVAGIRALGGLSGTPFLLVLSALIGLGGGLGAIGFQWLIATMERFFFVGVAGALPAWWMLPVVPALGLLIVAILVRRVAGEARGSGVPEVMASVATQEGRIRPRVVIAKSIASATSIGCGGSVGREGPIVHIGSAIGSSLGQIFGLSGERLKVLVGCGAAAGISATFNAPIAGGLYALEVILGDFHVSTFSPILLSSVLANAVTHSFVGNRTALDIPSYSLVSPYELVFYAGLAVLGGVVATVFTRTAYKIEDLAAAIPLHPYLKAIGGGLLLGCIGLVFPQVFGVGYDTVTAAVLNNLSLQLLIALVVIKTLATSITLGAGGSGGIFAPSLFIGAMMGGAYGHIVELSGIPTAGPGAYAAVGMGVMVAGTTHAPLTAMLILFEMTDDYQIILPLILGTVVSTMVARHLLSDSFYTMKLSRRGIRLAQGMDLSVLDTVRVSDTMTKDPEFVHLETPFIEIARLIQEGEQMDYPVVNDDNILQGMVSFQDVRPVMMDEAVYPLLVAADVLDSTIPAVASSATLAEAMGIFAEADASALPVVSNLEERRMVGVITHAGLLSRYHHEIRRRQKVMGGPLPF